MSHPKERAVYGILINIISDGFNRSMGALEEAGAIDSKKMQEHYKGVGSKFYDLVTEQIEYTAKFGAPAICQLFSSDDITGQKASETSELKKPPDK